ncbi:helix-turn-helix transcriptional regulator [Anaerotardibacter muris]|uniref:helix-turn-helix transcriptional regulator n=1 Tax=Anaerotardibacter muris TaxID=2941505 RepID=UPI00203EAEC3|nr:WYL domain-containing protein [Anaerotardibacter muris]
MANRPNQKLRLLHLAKILFEQTDSNHGLTTKQVIEELYSVGYEAERKAIYRDIRALKSFGLSIQQKSGKEWYIASRPFDLRELLFISDLIQSSPTLTKELTDTLLAKIHCFCSANQRRLFRRQSETGYSVKQDNEQVLTNLEQVCNALQNKRAIEFNPSYRTKGGLSDTDNKKCVYPIKVELSEGFYDVTYFDPAGEFSTYRLDHMEQINVLEEHEKRSPTKKELVHRCQATVKTPVVLESKMEDLSLVHDRFGSQTETIEKAGGFIRSYVRAPLDASFFSWVIQHYPKIRLISPEKAVEAFNKKIEQIHRSCKMNRMLLSSGEFKELTRYLKQAVEDLIEEDRAGAKFETEDDFCEVAADKVES